MKIVFHSDVSVPEPMLQVSIDGTLVNGEQMELILLALNNDETTRAALVASIQRL